MFGVFELDLRTRELRKHGIKLKLQGKPFALLAALLERPGELISREDLFRLLWPDDTHVDFEHSLGIAIWKVRQALGDGAENPRFIETLRGRGVRFIAPVRTAATPLGSTKRLAVLPFVDLGRVRQDEYFVDGLTDEMISQLGRLNPAKLAVIARTSAMNYKRTTKPVPQIGRELNVAYVLEGTVRRSRGRVRIGAHLIRVADEAQVWADSFDCELADVITMQAEAARKIAEALTIELLPEQRGNISTTSSRAFELYLKGRYEWAKRTDQAISRALEHFHAAVAEDPQYALAHTGLADSYSVLGYYGLLSPGDAFSRAKSAAERALLIDNHLAEAHCSAAFCTLQHDWDWPAAERAHLRAIELNRNYAPAFHWYGLDLAQVGRLHEAQEALLRAQDLDPVGVAIRAHYGRLLYFARQYGHAIETLRSALQLDETYAPASYFLGLALVQSGERGSALAELRNAVQIAPANPVALSGLVFGYGRCGKKREGLHAFEKLKSLTAERRLSPFFIGFAAAGLDEADTCFEALEQAYVQRFGWLMYLKSEPAFDGVRTDPRFTDLLQRVDPLAVRSASRTDSGWWERVVS
jgi:TolB-like protein/Tfp pilus assembly protein PilF